MGCSGIIPRKWNKDNEFYKEALGFRENKLKGLRVDDDIEITHSFDMFQIGDI